MPIDLNTAQKLREEGVVVPYDHQLEAAHRFLLDKDVRQRKLILIGTGGGKTALALILTKVWLRRGTFTHIVYTTPRTQLRKQVLGYASREFHLPEEYGDFEQASFPDIVECSTAEQLKNYYASPQGRVAVATANVVIGKARDYLAEQIANGSIDASKLLFIPDEGHHVHDMDDYEEPPGEDFLREDARIATLFSQFIRFCLSKGVHLLKLTGTAYRGDGRPVYDPDPDKYTVHITTMMELMIRGLAPTQLLSKVRRVKGEASDDLHTSKCPLDLDATVEAVLDEFIQNDKAPSLTRLKPGKPKRNEETFTKLVKAFQEYGGVVNGYGKKGEEALEEALNAEAEELDQARKEKRPACYNTLKSMLLGIHRLTEGMDSPARCCGYMIGIPRSFNVLAQFIGRLLRLRISLATNRPLYADYPERWLKTSKITFFIGNVSDADERHCETILKTCLYLDSFANASLIRCLFSVDDGIANPSPTSNEDADPTAPSTSNEEGPPPLNGTPPGLTSADVTALANWAEGQSPTNNLEDQEGEPKSVDEVLVLFRAFWKKHEGAYSERLPDRHVPEVAQLFAKDFLETDISLEALKRHMGSKIALKDPEALRRARETVARLRAAGSLPVDALQQALESVFEEFSDATWVSDSTHSLNGEIIEEFAKKVIRKVEQREHNKPETQEEILRRAQAFRQTEGRWPDLRANSGDLDPEYAGWSFREYNGLLRRGDGIPKLAGGLPELLCLHLGWSWDAVETDVRDYVEASRESNRNYINRHPEGWSRQENFRRLYPDNLILAYYPKAPEAFRWIPQVVRLLEPKEADALGRAIGREARAPLVAAIFDQHGIEEVRLRLQAGTLRELGAP